MPASLAMTFSRSNILTLLFLAAVSEASASDVLLLLEAKDNASIIARVDSADPAIAAASAVLDTKKGARDWMWTEYTTTIEGYVPTESLSKNFDIAPDTFVRSSPNTRANVLTLAEADDRFEVLASNGDWATVRFRKAIPVYFLKNGLNRITDTATTSAPPTPQSQPRPKRPSKLRIDPDAKVANLSPGTLPPENVIWSSAPTSAVEPVTTASEPETAPIKQAAIMVAPTEFIASGTPRSPKPALGTPTRTLTGKLVREIHSFGPRYPIRLKGSSGRRLAYVDMSRIFINDLRPYLDKTVYISGEVHPIVPGSPDLVILARTIRIEQ